MVTIMSSSWKEACGKKKLQTGEGAWKLRGSSNRLRQQAGQEGYMQRQFSDKGGTEDFFLLRTDANWECQLQTSFDRREPAGSDR